METVGSVLHGAEIELPHPEKESGIVKSAVFVEIRCYRGQVHVLGIVTYHPKDIPPFMDIPGEGNAEGRVASLVTGDFLVIHIYGGFLGCTLKKQEILPVP